MSVRQKGIDPNKIAIYVRWSTEDQGEGTTLAVQLEGCKAYVQSQGWSVSENLVFIDDGVSGGSLKRPAMDKLRRAVRNGQVDCVVVLKLDRLSRSVVDTVNLVLEEWDGLTYVKSAREPIDTTSPMGKQFFYMLVSYAEWERNVIRERTFSGKLKRAQEGRNPGFKPPYGYQVGDAPGTFTVNPQQAEVVQRIFREYLGGSGVQAIAHLLNQEGIPFQKGRPWNDSTVSWMLKNEIYTGRLVYGKLQRNQRRGKRGGDEPFWVRNDEPLTAVASPAVPAIISESDFEAVQKLRLQRNVKASGVSGRALASPHLLTGLVHCRCGHGLTAVQPRKGSAFYYKCKGARTKGAAYCDAGYIRQDELDAQVVDRVRARFLPRLARDELAELLNDQQMREIRSLERSVAQGEGLLADLDAQLERVIRDYRAGDLTVSEFREIKNQIDRERAAAGQQLDEHRQFLAALKHRAIDLGEVEAFAQDLDRWALLTQAEQKNLLRRWVYGVQAYKPTGQPVVEMHITWRWEEVGTQVAASRA